jgi:hypothetical protein
MTQEEANKLKPWDVIIYTPEHKDCLVKEVTEFGVRCLFRIQSTSQLCRFEDLEKF